MSKRPREDAAAEGEDKDADSSAPASFTSFAYDGDPLLLVVICNKKFWCRLCGGKRGYAMAAGAQDILKHLESPKHVKVGLSKSCIFTHALGTT